MSYTDYEGDLKFAVSLVLGIVGIILTLFALNVDRAWRLYDTLAK